MRWFLILALVAGCDRTASKVEAVKREVCTCRDVGCAEAAMKKLPSPDKVSRREQELARDMLDCLAKLYAGALPADSDDQPALGLPAAPSSGSNSQPSSTGGGAASGSSASSGSSSSGV